MAWIEFLHLQASVGLTDLAEPVVVGACVEIPPDGIGFGRLERPANWPVPWVQLHGARLGVGQHHTRISQGDGGWCVTHSGTTNPTLLNGVPVHHTAPLRHGDVIDVARGAQVRFLILR